MTDSEDALKRKVALLQTELVQIRASRAYRLALWLQKIYQHSGLTRWVVTRFAPLAAKVLSPEIKQTTQSETLVETIEHSPLFDSEYYRQRYSVSALSPKELARDFLRAPIEELRDPGPLFCSSYYLDENPDIVGASLHPFIHFLSYGMKEGRAGLAAKRVDDFLRASIDGNCLEVREVFPPDRPINVHVYGKGNFFFKDIAAYTCHYLQSLGFETSTSVDATGKHTDLVVAPHEFMVLGEGANWPTHRVKNAIYLNTEQWQTSWFSRSLPYLTESKFGVLDINPNSAIGLRKLGLPAAFLPMLALRNTPFENSATELREVTHRNRLIHSCQTPVNFNERPYDLFYFGVSNSRRDYILASLAQDISRWPAFLHTPKHGGPIKDDDVDSLAFGELNYIARRSKILLNIHRSDVGYFEWHRIVLNGITNGCVVVTEPCHRNSHLEVGKHYLECPARQLGEYLRNLIETDSGQKKLEEIHANNLRLTQELMSGSIK